VRLRRGDLFRGFIDAKAGVTYAAYGEGEKPKIYAWKENLANKDLWELYDKEHNIWKYRDLINDCGTLVFENGEKHSRKRRQKRRVRRKHQCDQKSLHKRTQVKIIACSSPSNPHAESV
jgi:hypothetical protein